AADREDQSIKGKGPPGQRLLTVGQWHRAKLDHLAAPIQAGELPGPITETIVLGMSNETDVFVAVVCNSRGKGVQHRLPDVRTVVIDEEDTSRFAAPEPTAQMGCGNDPRDPAADNDDTVHGPYSRERCGKYSRP